MDKKLDENLQNVKIGIDRLILEHLYNYTS